MNDIEFAAYYHLEYQGEIDADNLFRWCDEDRDGFLTSYEFEHCYCNEGEYVYVEPQHTIQRCSDTAASLYEEFNDFDSNAELSIEELSNFFVAYYETDHFSATLFEYCD